MLVQILRLEKITLQEFLMQKLEQWESDVRTVGCGTPLLDVRSCPYSSFQRGRITPGRNLPCEGSSGGACSNCKTSVATHILAPQPKVCLEVSGLTMKSFSPWRSKISSGKV